MKKKKTKLIFNVLLALSGVLLSIGTFSCSSLSLPQAPLPFDYLTEIPEQEFLFVSLRDDDYTCLDSLCSCPVSEEPAPSFEFIDGILVLNAYFFDPLPDNWITFRNTNKFIALYSFSSQWDGQLKPFSTFPMSTPEGDFVIIGVNPQGQIQVKSKDGHSIIPVGASLYSEQPELRSADCKVLHKYSLTNHGLIKDENVRFNLEGNW